MFLRAPGYRYATMDFREDFSEPGWDEETGWREVWKRLGSEALWLGLTLARPLAGQVRPTLRTLRRRKGVILGAAGVLGAAAAAGAWWTLRHDTPPGCGTLQGGALSPLLSNVYLHQFDLAMTGRGHNLVRYCDDFVICCSTEEDARNAGQDAAKALADLRLTLSPEKTRVVSFERGFRFLGYHFQGQGLAPTGGERARQKAEKALQRGRQAVDRLRGR